MPVSPDDARDLAKGMLETYQAAELRLLDLIGRAVADGVDTPQWQERQLIAVQKLRAQTAQLLVDLEQAGSKAAAVAIQAGYNRGAAVAGVDLANLGGSAAQGFGGIDTGAVQSLIRAAQGHVSDAGLVIRSQQEAIYRDVVTRTNAAQLTEGLTRRQASWDAMQQWADKGVTGFIDKAGKQWSMTSYAEMIARTGASQAIVQGHIDRLEDAGMDLVMISDAPEECDLCRPWEGKVLSAKGRTMRGHYTTSNGKQYDVAGTLAQATAAGLFHPNCRHRTVAYLPGITPPLTDTADPEGDKLRQAQRYKERRIRVLKRRALSAEQVAGKGSPDAVAARAKLAASNKDFAAWRAEHGRKNLAYRTSIKTPGGRPPKAPTLPSPTTPPTPPKIVKTQLTGSFAPKPPVIEKHQLTGSFAPKAPAPVEKHQLGGSFAPKPPPAPAPLKPKPAVPKVMSLADFKVAAKQPAPVTPAPKPVATPRPVKPVAGARDPGRPRRGFKSAGEGKDWAASVWPGPEGYTAEQLHAIKQYTDDGYERTNGNLRAHKGKRGGSRGLNGAMSAAPRVPEEIVVARGTTQAQFGLPPKADLSKLTGQTFTEHGYLSTSVDSKGRMAGEVHLKLSVPKGHKAVYVSGDSKGRGILSSVGGSEAELILDKGSQFLVTSVKRVKGKWLVEADILPA